MQDLTGTTVGRYEIRRRIGKGGMGEVYEARHTRLGNRVAIKRLVPELSVDDTYRKHFLKEAQHAARLNHPCIAGVQDVIEQDGELLLVMDYVPGTTLRESIQGGPMKFGDFLGPAIECAEALDAAHQQGIIHHDIKPGNIMMTKDRHIKVLDFGLARRVYNWTPDATTEALSTTASDLLGGTPSYMAPETLRGRPEDHRVDIFALGIVFCEMLTGKHPFLEQTSAATQDRILNGEPFTLGRFDPHIPEEMDRIVAKMLAKDPEDRYATSKDLLVDLRLLRKRPGKGGGGGGIPRWVILAASTLLILVAAIVVVIGARRLIPPSLPDQRNVAVFPIALTNGDEHDAAFARGLGHELVWRLGRVSPRHGFTVVPASFLSARRVAGVGEIGEQVGADLALLATIDRFGGDAVVNLRLVAERDSSKVLRQEEVTYPFADPIALEYALLETVMAFLDEKPESRDLQDFVAFGTPSPTAYHLYLQGLGDLLLGGEPNITQAIDALVEACALDEGFARARVGLGRARFARVEGGAAGEADEARALYLEAASLEPDLASAQMGLAELALENGDPAEAEAHFRKARYLEPANDDALRGLVSSLRAQGRLDEIEPVYRNAIEENPRYWRTHASLGVHLFRLSRFPEAVEALEQALEMAPLYFRAYNTLGAARAEMGDWEAATEAFERSIDIRPTGMTYTNLGNVYFFQGRFRKAVETYQSAIIFLEREKRLYCGIYGNLGDAFYWAPGQREKAAPQYRRAIEMARQDLERNPDDSQILTWMATYHAMLGEREEALDALARGLAVAPDGDPEVLYQAALVHCQLGDTGEAFGYLGMARLSGALLAKIGSHPSFEGLREDGRYEDLLAASE